LENNEKTLKQMPKDQLIAALIQLQNEIASRQDSYERTVSLLNATIESTADGILVVDQSGKIISFNRKFAQLWKIPDSVTDSRDDDQALAFVLNQLTDPEGFFSRVRELYNNPALESFDVLEFKDGRVFERYSLPQKLGTEIVGRVWSFRDVTERKKAEMAAEKATLAKTQFLANVSHEIRTPLGGILGFSELLLNSDQSSADRLKWVNRIKSNGAHLLEVVDEILGFSKAEFGKIDVDISEVNIPKLVSDISLSFYPKILEKGISLDFRLDGTIPQTIQTDRTKLKQILINIIGNAIKFTEKGSVTVTLKHQEPSMLCFLVKDTGIGVKPDEAQNLFHPFVQADSSYTRRFGGTGLGLALARKLATALGGNVELVASTPGRGCTFLVTVKTGPLDHVRKTDSLKATLDKKAESIEEVEQTTLSGIKVLLVEDSPDNQLLISKFLDLAGAQVDVADNGDEGIKKAWKSKHDIILMDIQMPVKDGYQAIQELRKNGYKGPIVALTAHAMKQEREQALLAGCNDHIAKPVSRKSLVEAVKKITNWGFEIGSLH